MVLPAAVVVVVGAVMPMVEDDYQAALTYPLRKGCLLDKAHSHGLMVTD